MIPTPLTTKIYATFDRRKTPGNLTDLSLKLLSEQKAVWPDLEQSYKTLKNVKVRDIFCNGFSVRLQHNPGRTKSTLADVRGKSINERPCFLCSGNLPEEQKGILYQEDYLILCNPMPVFSGHLTISHLIHQPQTIIKHIDTFVQLMSDFGKGWSILYNGPRCGASAPDHLHFQAIPSGKMPIEKEITEDKRLVRISQIDSVLVSRAKDLGREIIVLETDKPADMVAAFNNITATFKRTFKIEEEPMMSLAGFHDGKKWLLMIFPRAKHRPDAFFRQGADRIAVSPAVIEMGGVLVTPVEKDFQYLNAPLAESIFREVSLFLSW